MLIPLDFLTREQVMLHREHYEESIEHAVFTERLRKTLYYGKTPNKDRPSLPVTELAVGFLQDAAPRQLGKVDLSLASHVSREACIAPCSLMLGMIYVERLKHRNPEYLQQVSSSDLFLISMMMASKYLYDEGVDEEVFNDEWAESADMDVDELNSLERDFLRAIDWQLFAKRADFFSLLERIERSIAYTQCKERGFHTYTDLMVLTEHGRLNEAFFAVLSEISKVLLVCSVAYVAGVMTILGSTVSLVYLQHTLPMYIPSQPIHAISDSVLLPRPDSGFPSLSADFSPSLPASSLLHQDTGYQWNQRTEPPGKADGRLSMTGFLTLALIKDTLLQFVEGVKAHAQQLSDWDMAAMVMSDSELNERDNVVCTCGCCTSQLYANRHCVNVSSAEELFVAANAEWNEDCDQDAHSQRCCCSSTSQTWPLDRPWRPSPGPTLSSLHLRFHNVILGFGTTAEPLSLVVG